MTELFPFFIVIFAGLFFSELFRKLHIPWVVALILSGIIIGPHGMGIFEPDKTIEFLGQVGLVFIMFMAGLETKFSGISSKESRHIPIIAILNGGIPFLVGFGIGVLFGYSTVASLLIGVIFISSSVAVIIPSLKTSGLINTKIGRSIVSATMLEDVFSLILLSVVLQSVSPATDLPLIVFYVLLFATIFILMKVIKKMRKFFSFTFSDKSDLFQQELRSIFVILIGTVIAFELLGLHSIIAGFFAGFVLSKLITNNVLKEKLAAIGYGLFIPIFFVVVGSKTNIGIFTESSGTMLLTGVILSGAILSKFFSGFFAGKVTGFHPLHSALIGSSTIPQLSTTLAVAFTGLELGILDEGLITAMVALSITTTFVGPTISSYINGKIKKVRKTRTVKGQPTTANTAI